MTEVLESTHNETHPHPKYHDWEVWNDEIIERTSRNVPSVLRREERCKHCPRWRRLFINVRGWYRVGKPYYSKNPGVTIYRIDAGEFLKDHVLNTTTLVGKDLEALQR